MLRRRRISYYDDEKFLGAAQRIGGCHRRHWFADARDTRNRRTSASMKPEGHGSTPARRRGQPHWNPSAHSPYDRRFGQTTKWDGDQLIVISAFWDAAQYLEKLYP